MIPLVVGVLWLIYTRKENRNTLLAVLFSAAFLCLSTFGGGRSYDYYPMPFVVYGIYGLIAGVLWLRKVMNKKLAVYFADNCRFSAGLCLCTVILLVSSFFLSDNTYLLSYERDDIAQFRFADYIRQKEDPTLLMFGALDFGMYYTADVTPNCEFFCELNIPLPEMYDTQWRYVREGLVDFVVTRDFGLEDVGLGGAPYRLVEQRVSTYQVRDANFYLYEKIVP